MAPLKPFLSKNFVNNNIDPFSTIVPEESVNVNKFSPAQVVLDTQKNRQIPSVSQDEINNAIQNSVFGTSGTDLNKFDVGAFKNVVPKADSIVNKANATSEVIDDTKSAVTTLTPLQQARQVAEQAFAGQTGSEPDWGIASLLYFSKMAEEASKPGATFLGAAGTAGTAPAAYLMQKEKQKADLATKKASLIATLTPSLTTAATKGTDTKLYTNTSDQPIRLPNGTVVESGKQGRISQKDFTKLGANANLFAPYKAPPKLDKFQRQKADIDRIGPLIIAGTASEEDKATYSISYQSLTKGGTKKTFDKEGNETEVNVPGINLLNEQDVYPLPRGITANDIISKKSRKYGEAGKVAGYANRMLLNEGILRDVFAKGYQVNVGDIVAENVGFGTIGVTDEGKEFYNASRNWVAAVLRRESGAAISAKEYADGLAQYFPRLGDSTEVRLQKQALRESVTRGFVNESGDAFTNIYKDAVPFLSYTTKDGEVKQILNPQGYSRGQLKNVYDGKGYFTNDTIDSFSVQDIQGILKKDPKFLAKIYSLDDLKYMNKALKLKKLQEKSKDIQE
tara:strand:- start:325 stop:2019 length:1695 start_codon:yes stop_codon:yes gene_type:complete